MIEKNEETRCKYCDSLIKPDIVFFGESLPSRFHELMFDDFKKADLLLVLGTSLQVAPFNLLIGNEMKLGYGRGGGLTPRVLINRDRVGCALSMEELKKKYAEERERMDG